MLLPENLNLQPSHDFRTHQNYLEFLSTVSDHLNCNLNKTYRRPYSPSRALNNKLGLTNLTLESIEMEVNMAHTNSAYAKLLSIWLPVKGYYVIYHLMCLIQYLDSGNLIYLNASHIGSIKAITQLIKNGEISFNQPYFNWMESGISLKKISIPSGANLSNLTKNHDQRCIQILKIIHRYKTEDLRRNCRGGAIRTRIDREKRANLDRNLINIFELFYWYRIRANYKDLDIIEENLMDSFYVNYVDSYYSFLNNYVNSLKGLINAQATQRGLSNTIQFTLLFQHKKSKGKTN